MTVSPKNQLQKSQPLVLSQQSEPSDDDMEPGEFAIFPKVLEGKVELHTKSKDMMGVVTPSTNLTKDGGPVSDQNGDFQQYVVTLTTTNISNKYFILNPTPINGSEVAFIPLTGLEQLNGEDFQIVSGNRLSWASLGLDGDLVAGDKILVKYFG